MPAIRVKNQLMSASEMDRTLVRLAHEVLEKSADLDKLAFIGIRRRGVLKRTLSGRFTVSSRDPAGSAPGAAGLPF